MPYKDPEKAREASRRSYQKQVSTPEGAAAHREKVYAWREANREKHLAQQRAQKKKTYARDREKFKDYRAEWRAANRDKTRAYSLAHYYRNKAAWNANNAKRRAAKLQRTPVWSETLQIRALYECAARLTKCLQTEMHVDHWFPLLGVEVSGLHVLNNLRVITAAENLRKNNKWISEHALGARSYHIRISTSGPVCPQAN